jgi:2'-5' RNA ligase
VRLFVAIRPSRQAVAHLGTALTGRRTSPPDRWHVTLAFLGEVDDPSPLRDPLRAAALASSPFELHLAGGGAFSGSRVAWAGVKGDVDGLSALAAAVQHAAREVGVPVDQRRFRPHLTVGDVRRVPPAVLDGYAGPTWRVREVELVHSVLGRAATHIVLDRFPLYQA